MKTLYFDCFSGISGDMAVGALLDLGVPFEVLEEGIRSLGLPGVSVSARRAQKCGIEGTKFEVFCDGRVADDISSSGKPEHHHDHDHDHEDGHSHGHGHSHDGTDHVHRGLSEIIEILSASSLSDSTKKMAEKIFHVIAEAEGRVHGLPPEHVHFHEVGAVDSIVDIAAVALCLDYLKPDRVEFSKVREGRGFINCAHGRIPVPAPATLEIIKSSGLEVEFSDTKGELVTPTGAAIAAAIGEVYGSVPPAGRVAAVGNGAGSKDFQHPNLLRTFLIETDTPSSKGIRDTIIVLETAIDNSTGEELGYAAELLWKVGCVDVYFTAISMKKSRPGVLLTALVPESAEKKAVEILFRHTGTIGVRRRVSERHIMERRISETVTRFGGVTVKTASYGNLVKRQTEYESLRKAAQGYDLTLRAVAKEADGHGVRQT